MKGLLAGLIFLTMVTGANATSYNFSYTFASDGQLITGSFDGTQNGDLVEGLSNISVAFDGVAFNGPLFGSCYSSGWQTGCAVASFSGDANNFRFIDSNYPDDTTYTNYFSDAQLSGRVVEWDDTNDINTDSGSYGAWVLSAASVPESPSFYLLAFGLLGLFAGARRKV